MAIARMSIRQRAALRPHEDRIGAGPARRALTLVELLVSAMITALVAATAAAMISAVSDASLMTKDIQGTKQAGNYALSRIATTVREARTIGQVTSTSVSLWLTDKNGNDAPESDEVGVIAYDSNAKTITLTTGAPPTSGGPAAVPPATLKDAASMKSTVEGGAHTTTTWATDIESLTFYGSPSYTDTRIVEVQFTIGTSSNAVTFQTSASPRASADYLFVTNASDPATAASPRARRKKVSPWAGLSTLTFP